MPKSSQAKSPTQIGWGFFSKKINDGKAFEFNTNLTDVPNLIKALQYIVNENPTFFSSLKDC